MDQVDQAAHVIKMAFADRKRTSGIPYVAHAWTVANIVASYGGHDNTRGAPLLCRVFDGNKPVPIAGVDDAVMNIVIKVTEDWSVEWGERKQRYIAMSRHCCQGVGIVVIANAIADMFSFAREMAPDPVGYWAKSDTGFAKQIWFHWGLVDSLRNNKRLARAGAEYGDLRTWDALVELKACFALLVTGGINKLGEFKDDNMLRMVVSDMVADKFVPWAEIEERFRSKTGGYR